MKMPNPESIDSSKNQTGSPKQGEPVFLMVGKIRRPHGLDGELIMEIMTDFPERLNPGKTVYFGHKHEELVIKTIRNHDKTLLVRFTRYQNSDDAGQLRNQIIYVKSDNLPELPEGVYYHHELLGCEIVHENGDRLGVLEEIIETGANDVYLVKKDDGQELLIPAIESVILDVDIEKRVIRVRPPEWN
jgi:16S rRNA processing protein RimM